MSLDQYAERPLKGKTAAEAEADRIRAAIRAGTFHEAKPEPPQTAEALTLDAYGAIFLERYSKARQKVSWRDDGYRLRRVCAFAPKGHRFGTQPIGTITEDDVEAFMQDLIRKGRAASTQNHYLQLFKAMSNWGLRKSYLTCPWIGPLTDLKRKRHTRRSRRLQPDEEPKLLQVAPPRLYRLIVAAIDTGCREGELLKLQMKDVYFTRRELRIRAPNAKNRRDRYIPISARLMAVLEMAKHDPAGHPFGPEAYVFGNEVGHRIESPKKSWMTAVLKAHGHTPRWVKSALAPESRAAYSEINLTFHDLRHEAGSWWLEAGMPLHHVKELLGHANISTTDTYLNAGRVHLQESMRKVEAARSVAINATKCHKPLQGPRLLWQGSRRDRRVKHC